MRQHLPEWSDGMIFWSILEKKNCVICQKQTTDVNWTFRTIKQKVGLKQEVFFWRFELIYLYLKLHYVDIYTFTLIILTILRQKPPFCFPVNIQLPFFFLSRWKKPAALYFKSAYLTSLRIQTFQIWFKTHYTVAVSLQTIRFNFHIF